ncbi:hypothetical protein [Imtechella halotolerans]|uniref:Anti-sigma factor n=1 Tax=Imtechella halotolerans K1 TaxID=946077 RepID=I0WE53_9FLAO|nr:hypothetical protein [Imtechella halotolerans]EID74669.1 hypothetical protein W5A_07812 [Imtechella halotolerans K1]WMQ64210.1 hypothetical protein PT603_04350 [Imtechella halotolerans]
MELERDHFKELFSQQDDSNWNTQEPMTGHRERFMARLENSADTPKKSTFNWWKSLSIAASFVALVSLGIMGYSIQKEPDLASVSPEMYQSQLYFSNVIRQEVTKLEQEQSPETKQLISDALQQLEKIEYDYSLLKDELVTKGEDKRIIQAMIANFQMRIDLLTTVLDKIEEVKQIKLNPNENIL